VLENDSTAHARRLGQLLRRNPRELPLYHIDLIPYNAAERAGELFTSPEPQRVREFLRVLRQMGISCSARTQFGSDISAACGQLCAEEKQPLEIKN
jgi:23S rRNA (adenine-C8)-methyltransferase